MNRLSTRVLIEHKTHTTGIGESCNVVCTGTQRDIECFHRSDLINSMPCTLVFLLKYTNICKHRTKRKLLVLCIIAEVYKNQHTLHM